MVKEQEQEVQEPPEYEGISHVTAKKKRKKKKREKQTPAATDTGDGDGDKDTTSQGEEFQINAVDDESTPSRKKAKSLLSEKEEAVSKQLEDELFGRPSLASDLFLEGENEEKEER